MTPIKVGMAEFKVTKSPNALTTLGLGSCVGIVLYDKLEQVVGLAHIMLPSSKQIRNNSNKAKFSDTAIDELLKEMFNMGASKNRIMAKLAGGAQMFALNGKSSSILNIGHRNVQSTLQHLKEYGIPLIAQDTGGSYGRTIIAYPTGRLIVKTIGHGTGEI